MEEERKCSEIGTLSKILFIGPPARAPNGPIKSVPLVS